MTPETLKEAVFKLCVAKLKKDKLISKNLDPDIWIGNFSLKTFNFVFYLFLLNEFGMFVYYQITSSQKKSRESLKTIIIKPQFRFGPPPI